MFYQKVVKGISDIPVAEADDILLSGGIRSNWWRHKGTIQEDEIAGVLTEDRLVAHLDYYDHPDPANPSFTYGQITPFISTTAGSVQRDAVNKRNILYSPFLTALEFATRGYSTYGYIFYAYVLTIGKKAVEMRQFAEEVRELNIYTDFRTYHAEGEITAKISIPAIQIEKYQKFEGPKALVELEEDKLPTPESTQVNPHYQRPEELANIRELL